MSNFVARCYQNIRTSVISSNQKKSLGPVIDGSEKLRFKFHQQHSRQESIEFNSGLSSEDMSSPIDFINSEQLMGRSMPLLKPHHHKSISSSSRKHQNSDSNLTVGFCNPQDLYSMQVKSYVININEQLELAKSDLQVKDFVADLQDGIVVGKLLEIISGCRLELKLNANHYIYRKANWDEVLNFMKLFNIKISNSIASSDLADGHLKSLMCIILSLSPHFKPVRMHTNNAIGAHFDQGRESLTKTTGNSWETTNNQEGRMIESAPILTSTKDERVVFPKYSIQVLQKTIETLKRDKDRDVEHNIYCEKLSPLNTDASQESGEDDVFKSSKDDKVTDNLLAQLQDLLAQTCPVSKEQTFPASELFERKRNDDQIDWQKKYNTDVCVLERKVEHANCVISELKSEVFNSRQDWYKIQGAKTGLETRLSEKDRQYSKLKKEYKQMENILEKTQTSLMEMHCSADKNSKSNSDLARKLAQKERYADHKKKQLHDLQRSYDDLMNKVMIYEKEREQKDELIRTYRKQLSDMYNRLIQAGVKEGEIYQMSSFRDPHGLPPSPSVSKGSTKDGSGDEAQMVQKALADLRLCFSECDPHVHSIETIDQCVQVLSEKIQKTQPDFSISQPDSRHKKESRKMKLPPSEGGIQPNRVTKILYYIPKSSTPFMAIIPKRVDQITLADFKAQIVEYVSNKKQRFLFKTIDPEFGTVKEEIDDDNCKLPGWEGKIIAWIEE